MSGEVLDSYDRVEHYSSSVSLDINLDADITVFTVYGDSTDSMDEEFQMIEYSFNRDVSRGLSKFRGRAEEFTEYRFFPILDNSEERTDMTLMINNLSDRAEASNLAEELVKQVHEEIGL